VHGLRSLYHRHSSANIRSLNLLDRALRGRRGQDGRVTTGSQPLFFSALGLNGQERFAEGEPNPFNKTRRGSSRFDGAIVWAIAELARCRRRRAAASTASQTITSIASTAASGFALANVA
jgi:hypothetical protein